MSEKQSNAASNSGTGAKVESGSVMIWRLVLLAVAVLFIILGVLNGGIHDMFIKAVNICTECIGLG